MNKNKRILPLIIGVVALLTIVVAAVVVLTKKNEEYRVLKVENYEGMVTLERDVKQEDIFEGMNLKSQDTVTTGSASLIEILADSDKHILAEENTCFSIESTGDEEKGKIAITLEYGTSLYTIENKLNEDSYFEVTTPNATLSVRGTTFEVSYDKDKIETTLVVSEGIVEVVTATEIKDVEAGNAVTITGYTGTIAEVFSGVAINELPIYTDEVAFYLSKWLSEENVELKAELGVKLLEGWTYVDASHDEYIINELKRDGVSIRYTASDESEYNNSVSYREEQGHIVSMETVENSDGDEIICIAYDFKGENGSYAYGYDFYKKITEDMYLHIYIYDEDGGTSLGKIDINKYIDITRDCYYVLEGDVSESNANESIANQSTGILNEILADGISEEEFPEVLKGNANLTQLQFLLEVMQKCKVNGNENYLSTALSSIYYNQKNSDAYTPIAETNSGCTYDVTVLNNMFSVMTDEQISASNIPMTCTINGNELTYQACTVSSGGKIAVTIDNYYVAENAEIVVEYSYHMTYGSDGMSGVDGTSIAHLMPDEDGKYKINSIENVTVEEFEY
uniref:FecR family protein n=1 Tax=Acetatifactor sp. TaxID=1872090 RepID=UPI00405641B3